MITSFVMLKILIEQYVMVFQEVQLLMIDIVIPIMIREVYGRRTIYLWGLQLSLIFMRLLHQVEEELCRQVDIHGD